MISKIPLHYYLPNVRIIIITALSFPKFISSEQNHNSLYMLFVALDTAYLLGNLPAPVTASLPCPGSPTHLGQIPVSLAGVRRTSALSHPGPVHPRLQPSPHTPSLLRHWGITNQPSRGLFF